MILTMDELLKAAAFEKKHTIAVACAQGTEVLRAVWTAHRAGIAEAILVGDEEKIHKAADASKLSLNSFSIVHESDRKAACWKAISLIRAGKASALMKGAVDTAVLMRAVLDRSKGLRGTSLLSHVALLDLRRLERPLLLTDAALNIAPGLEENSSKRRACSSCTGQSVANSCVPLRRRKCDPENARYDGGRHTGGSEPTGRLTGLSGVRPRSAG